MSRNEEWFPSHIREIDAAECLDLLAGTTVGRVAYCDEDGPVVLPVNYVVNGGDVMFRISPHSSLAQHLRSGPAAFQIDESDAYTQSGWSVLVRGTAAFVEYDELPEPTSRPSPWPEGNRTLHVRITPSSITGRRLLAA
jgi:uncharacterized protein